MTTPAPESKTTPSSGMPSLLNSPLDLIALRKAARDEVVAALDSVSSESKALVLDPALSGSLGLLAEVR